MARTTFRKVITSEEAIENINPKNRKLMQRFLKHKNAKCSDATIVNYTSDLNIFMCYNLYNNDNKFFIDLKKIELAEFFDYGLLELKWSGNRYARMRSLLSSFSTFICDYLDEDYPDFKNLINKAVPKIPKTPVRKKTVIKSEEVYKLRDMLIEQGEIQQACYLMLLASSGARISESLRITVDMIDEEYDAFGGLFLETKEEIKTKGHGKKGEMMTRFILKDTFLPCYKLWLPERDKILKKKGLEHNSMFIRTDGKPISVGGVNYWISKWEEMLGINFYAHQMRHYLVSELTRLGCSSDFIIAIIKWKSGDMYKIYNDVEDKDKKWKDIDKLKNVLDNNENLEVDVDNICNELDKLDENED